MRNHSITTIFSIILLVACSIMPSWAEEGSLEHTAEFHASGSKGKTPLWLNANKYGVSTLNNIYAYGRGMVSYHNKFTPWDVKYTIGGDLIVPFHFNYEGYNKATYTSSIILQQLYVDIHWKRLLITGGAKQQKAEMRDNLLSSGAQTLGINARPIPQGRIALDDWWRLPLFHHWLSFKGHIAYGIMTDANWEESFIGNSGNKYNRWTRYHEKAGYLRIGKQEVTPLSLTLGLEMGTQFGGTIYNYYGTDQQSNRGQDVAKLQSNLKSYINAFLGRSSGDVDETKFLNSEGNHLGSWVCRIDWKTDNFEIGLYGDHFFEDHSGMLFIDYDGYGQGSEWSSKKEFKYLSYPLKDGQLGVDVKLNNGKLLQGAVVEFMNTRYQSGPIYHDHNEGNSDHTGGIDDYYNHYSLPGWQHWGQAIGNPLFRSPQYNKDGKISFEANRFFAWHTGIRGNLLEGLNYRVLYTWQKTLGTYRNALAHPQENTSVMMELDYQFPTGSLFEKFHVRAAFGADYGKMLGDNKGLQFTVQHHL